MPQQPPISISASPRDRGVAMLLVIVLLFATTILAGAALTSRNNSGDIGDNAVDTVSAEWAAESAARVTEAVLESSSDWLDLTSGKILTDFDLAGADVTVDVSDLEGATPESDDQLLLVTIKAIVDGVEVEIEKVLAVESETPTDPDQILSEELNEFAVYGVTGVKVDSSSRIAAWSNSPSYAAKRDIKLGMGADTTTYLDVLSDSNVGDAVFYVNSSASASLRSVIDGGTFKDGDVLALDVPVVYSNAPAALLAAEVMMEEDIEVKSDADMNKAGRFARVRVEDGASLNFNESAGTDYAFDEMRLDKGGIITVTGRVRWYIEGDLEVRGSSGIVFGSETSTLEVYIGGQLRIEDAAVGLTTEFAGYSGGRKVGRVGWYSDPSRMQFISIDTDGSYADWLLDDNAMLLGVIRAPQNNVILSNASFVIGRVTGDVVGLSSGSGLAYDKALDTGFGVTDKTGVLYDEDTGTPANGLPDAIAAFKAANPDERMGTWVRAWLTANGYDDCFTICDLEGADEAEVAEFLCLVSKIEKRQARRVVSNVQVATVSAAADLVSSTVRDTTETVEDTVETVVEVLGKGR